MIIPYLQEPLTKYNEKQTELKQPQQCFSGQTGLLGDPGWWLTGQCMIITRVILISGVLVNIIRAHIGQQDIIDTGYCTSGSLQHSYNNLL